MRYLVEVMYDGTHFHGSQLQGELPTVQYALDKTLSTIFRTQIHTFGASRTDEGVHALSNYYHFDLEEPFTFDLLYKCNAILPDGVAVKRIVQVPDDFNARFDALSRRYRYRIYHQKNPFLLNRAMFFPFKLNEAALHSAAEIFPQYTQFESFSKRNTQTKTFNCTIKQCYWQREGGELHFIVEANRFLRGMVRGLVATQLRVGRGKISADGLRHIIEAQDCSKAFFDVPGFGLYLEHVEYQLPV